MHLFFLIFRSLSRDHDHSGPCDLDHCYSDFEKEMEINAFEISLHLLHECVCSGIGDMLDIKRRWNSNIDEIFFKRASIQEALHQ